MAIIDAKATLWPGTGIPYLIDEKSDQKWVKENVNMFNAEVGRVVLYPLISINSVPYALITVPSESSTSNVGQTGPITKLFSKLDQTSFFHELGHLCGLRHENMHANAPADVKQADSSFRNAALFGNSYKPPQVKALTDYDPLSIMRYGGNTKNTKLSQMDIEGIRQLFTLFYRPRVHRTLQD